MSPERHQSPPQESAERWPTGRRIMERIRREVNAEGAHFLGEEGEDVFRSLYLTERFGCIPDHLLGEDILVDIRNLYYWVLDGVREELQERVGAKGFVWVAVDPSYEDPTYALLLHQDRVLLEVSRKAWRFYWESEEAMAEELEGWYQQAARRLGLRAVVGSDRSSEQEFVVTLRIARMLRVRASGPERAAELAMSWRDNEDDPDVQLSYEEVLDGTVRRVGEADDAAFPEPLPGGEGGASRGEHHG